MLLRNVAPRQQDSIKPNAIAECRSATARSIRLALFRGAAGRHRRHVRGSCAPRVQPLVDPNPSLCLPQPIVDPTYRGPNLPPRQPVTEPSLSPRQPATAPNLSRSDILQKPWVSTQGTNAPKTVSRSDNPHSTIIHRDVPIKTIRTSNLIGRLHIVAP